MPYTFYIDESGNTGTNWLDDSQPIFTYGGWLVENSKIETVENFVKEVLKNTQGTELKSSKMFKSNKGTNVSLNLIEKMLENNCIPFFVSIDKKYMLAAKIVESFFDPAYNPNLKNSITSSLNLKINLANFILEYDNSNILKDFLELLKNGTIEISTIKNINERLIKLFYDENYLEVSRSLENLTDENLKNLVSEFETLSNNGENKTKLTLTMPSIHDYLGNVNYYGDFVISDDINVIHDNLRGYDDNFSELKEIFFNNDGNNFKVEDKTYMLSLNRLTSLEMKDSKDELILQMADILVGFVTTTLKYSREERKLGKKWMIYGKHL